MQTIIVFLFVIIFLVVGHELGHFFAAKAFKIRVDEFGIGYPPRAKKMFTWRGTLFTLNWLPFGGFVKIYGETDSADGSKNSFAHQALWKRLLVVLAGIIANMVLAMVLYALSFGIGFLASTGTFPQGVSVGMNETIISAVASDSPARVAGFKPGDIIEKLESGKDVRTPESVTDVVFFVKAHPKDPITATIVRNGNERTIIVTPRSEKADTAPSIGVSLAEVTHVRLPFWKAVATGVKYTFAQFAFIIHSLGTLVSSSFGGGTSLISDVSGPIGIAQIAGEAYSLGFGSFLAFVALISVNLAVINLLPFPALDGGRFILEFFSKNGRSRIPQKVVSVVNQASFLLLILLMLYVTYHDIARLVA